MALIAQLLLQGLLIAEAVAHGIQKRTIALNKTLTNTVPNLGGPVLYYNGSGPVPGIDTLSPEPAALPALRCVQDFCK
jgi:sphingomyelin phosphodiesterase